MPRQTLDFERLPVFNRSLEALAAVDQFAGTLPYGQSHIRDQLRRAANSISLNIAEGAGEFAPGEKARFYRIARRSASECAGQVVVCKHLALGDLDLVENTLDRLAIVIAQLVLLIRRFSERELGSSARSR